MHNRQKCPHDTVAKDAQPPLFRVLEVQVREEVPFLDSVGLVSREIGERVCVCDTVSLVILILDQGGSFFSSLASARFLSRRSCRRLKRF